MYKPVLEVHLCHTEPAYIDRAGWRVVCDICGPVGNPPGRIYAAIGTARQVCTRHYWKTRVVVPGGE